MTEHNDRDTNVEPNHMQLAFSILLREKFEWVKNIMVYNPSISLIERTAMNALNCTRLIRN